MPHRWGHLLPYSCAYLFNVYQNSIICHRFKKDCLHQYLDLLSFPKSMCHNSLYFLYVQKNTIIIKSKFKCHLSYLKLDHWGQECHHHCCRQDHGHCDCCQQDHDHQGQEYHDNVVHGNCHQDHGQTYHDHLVGVNTFPLHHPLSVLFGVTHLIAL